jgi:hypothetical protein
LQEELALIVSRTNTTTMFVTHDVDLPRPRLGRQRLLDSHRAAELRDHVLRLVMEDQDGKHGPVAATDQVARAAST